MPDAMHFLKAVRHLNVCTVRGQRRPHQPLLLLVAISNLLQGRRELPFADVVQALDPLLKAYAPQVSARHQPELPYWHLRNSGLWRVPGDGDLPTQQGGFPRMEGLRRTAGHLDADFAAALDSDPALLNEVVREILDAYFPESLHADILAAIGLYLPEIDRVSDSESARASARRRDPKFRKNVLRAYEHRCAVTGFRAALEGQFFGCEAAHVRWHAYDGPDSVDNGFAVEPTLHKLFDAGAWTLSDDRKVLVSREFTESTKRGPRLGALHGRPLRSPQAGEPEVSVEFIRWHREDDQGGVFRQPALPL